VNHTQSISLKNNARTLSKMGKGPIYAGGLEIKELGNFHMETFYVDGVKFHSAEQYYQFCKNPGQCEAILAAPTPQECWRLGQIRTELPANWDAVKEKVMYRAVLAKFSQNTELMYLLMRYDPEQLVFCEGKQRDEWDEMNERIIRRVYSALTGATGSTRPLQTCFVTAPERYRFTIGAPAPDAEAPKGKQAHAGSGGIASICGRGY
jgi:ribA/ribD-fused uncharacterized protein